MGGDSPVAGMLPGIERKPRKKLEPSAERLLGLVHRWRDEVIRAGRKITRIALAFEAGRDGFWLARWLRAHGVEAHVIHPFEAENVHLRLGQAPGHRRTRGTGANDQDVNRGGHANESLAMRGRSINGV